METNEKSKHEQKKEHAILEDLATISCEEFYGVYYKEIYNV